MRPVSGRSSSQASAAGPAEHPIVGDRRLAGRVDLHPPAARIARAPGERQLDPALLGGRRAFDHRPVGLVDQARGEQPAEPLQRLAMAAEHQAAAGVLVEPVGELRPPRQAEAQAVEQLREVGPALRAPRAPAGPPACRSPASARRGTARARASASGVIIGCCELRPRQGAAAAPKGRLIRTRRHPCCQPIIPLPTTSRPPTRCRRIRRSQGSLRADVCIVGGGYTGLSALLHLAERGYDAVLLEAARVGAGASGRNGGQLASGQRIGQAALEAKFGRERARLLWQLAEEAKATVKEPDRAPSHRLRPPAGRARCGPQARPCRGAATRGGASRAPLRLPARPLRAARRDARRCSAPGATSAACSTPMRPTCIR